MSKGKRGGGERGGEIEGGSGKGGKWRSEGSEGERVKVRTQEFG